MTAPPDFQAKAHLVHMLIDSEACTFDQPSGCETCHNIHAALAAAYQRGQAEMAEKIAADCELNAAGPITGDGIIGPLQVVGIAQGFKWAAESARKLAAPVRTAQERK